MRQMPDAQVIMQAAKQLERLNPATAFGLCEIHQFQCSRYIAHLYHGGGIGGRRRDK